jgi:phosphomannomutase
VTAPALHQQARDWIDAEVDAADAAELRGLLDSGDEHALAERFAEPLVFGTAGLRAPMRAGPNGLNRAVVCRTSAGVAAWLADRGRSGGAVIVGYDARHRSAEFARDCAAVFAAAGFGAQLLPRALPTPVLAFAARRLDAVAAVMITASHNPRQDNGYKLYGADAVQIVPPDDREVEDAIRTAPPANRIPRTDAYRMLGDQVLRDYVESVGALVPTGRRQLRIVYTALHGVGGAVLREVFGRAGFTDLVPVPEQDEPDPDFPTVAYPNPEEPGALDRAISLARARRADLVIANDPDADRCAVAVPDGRDWRVLTGDEVGSLLADSLLRKGVRGTYATTVVSSGLLATMATRHGAGFAETLTGFKWIIRAAPDLVFGYEEALGYAVAPALVRDKDGISAALLVADLAGRLHEDGSSLPHRLDELAQEYGRYGTAQRARRFPHRADVPRAMARLRADPPARLLGKPVEVTGLPDADAVRASVPGARVVIRPSGTEAKLKAYLQVVVPDGSASVANRLLAQLGTEVEAWLGRAR